MIVIVAIGNLLLGLFSTQLAIRWKNIVIKKWAPIISAIIGLKIEMEGTLGLFRNRYKNIGSSFYKPGIEKKMSGG